MLERYFLFSPNNVINQKKNALKANTKNRGDQSDTYTVLQVAGHGRQDLQLVARLVLDRAARASRNPNIKKNLIFSRILYLLPLEHPF